jgi:hypothetical protein
VTFSEFFSPLVPIAGYELAIFDASKTVLLPFTALNATQMSRGSGVLPCGVAVPSRSVSLAQVLAGARNGTLLANLTAGVWPSRVFSVRATNEAGLSAVATSGVVVFDATGPALDPRFLAYRVGYASARASVVGRLAALQPSGLSFVTFGSDFNASNATSSSVTAVTSVGALLPQIGVVWIGIVDPESGLQDAATMSVSACTAAGCQAVMASLPVRLSARRAVISGLGLLPPNATLNASLTVVNRAGADTTLGHVNHSQQRIVIVRAGNQP